MQFTFSNYSAFGWHPLSVEAAIASIEYIEKHNLVENSRIMGECLQKKLSFAKPEGKGLCVGIPCPKDIESDCLKDGLSISYIQERLTFFPALDITEKEIDQAITIVRKHLK